MRGLSALTERLRVLRLDAESSNALASARLLLRDLADARRLLALNLLRSETAEEEVAAAAGVPWRVLAAWCRGDADPPLTTWHRIELEAERARARQASKLRRRDLGKDLKYRHKQEELIALKREYRMTEGRAARPFTHHSTDEIDELQALLDSWHVVPPDEWSEEEFVAAHGEPLVTDESAEPAHAEDDLDNFEWEEGEDFDLDEIPW